SASVFGDKNRPALFFMIEHQLAGSQLSNAISGISIKGETVGKAPNTVSTKKSAHCSALLKIEFSQSIPQGEKRDQKLVAASEYVEGL
ncbi:MAG: hypothetical protein PHD82_07400, partial [Candidatus Riflebacteria bacterium]|nr:hypothetical protein [Candidatus Riflebacteria bacterium]